MTPLRTRLTLLAALAACAATTPAARAHFLWIKAEPGAGPAPATVARAFFNEDPEPDAAFTKYLRDVRLVVAGQTVPSTLGTESRDARWVGRNPASFDSDLDLGVTSRGGKTFRLVYTARAQTGAVAADAKEAAAGLRVRRINEGEDRVQVLFDGKPVPKARIKVYSEENDPVELTADDQGRAAVPGIAAGKAALWANRVDPTPGDLNGRAFAETRYYATFTCSPEVKAPETPATALATMPAPAVTSLGAAVIGKWLYAYGGHIGRTHQYNVETASGHFRRLNLEDRTTWEDLPSGPDLQGLSLVSDGTSLYRVGGMSARNKPGEEHDLYSVADVARFDTQSRKWTDLPPMPEPRSTHDAAVVGRTLYVVGGWTMKGATEDSTFLDHALAIDLDRPSEGWRSVPQPFQRRALAAASYDGKLYVLGGLVGGGMKVERRVDIYDPSKNAWGRGPDLPEGTRTEGFGSSACELDGRLYVSGASGKIFRLNEAGDAWEAVGAWSLPRITHRLLPAPGHALLAVGGNARGQATPVIEAVRFGAPAASAGAGN